MKEVHFDVRGMSCAACSARVEKAAESVAGTEGVAVNLLKNSMVCSVDDTKADAVIAAVEKAVADAGYEALCREEGKTAKGSENELQAAADAETRQLKIRLYTSVVLCVILMAAAMGPMAGLAVPAFLDPRVSPVSAALTQLLLTIPVVALNFKFFRQGTKGLIHGAPNMDTLVAIGAGASLLFGIFALYRMVFALEAGDAAQTMHYAHNLYFDSAAMILTLITVGKYFEARAKGKTTAAVSALLKLVPETAVVMRNGTEVTVKAAEIVAGDTVVLKTGERIPVDGVVIEGTATVDESAMTGESLPVAKAAGDSLSGATLMTSGRLLMRAVRVRDETALAQIIRLVDEATSGKAPVARLADKVSAYFVPAVIGIAFVTAAVWLVCGYSWEFAATCAVSVLVISCPCALGLATPTAIMVGTGRGAAEGLLFKSAEVIEKTRSVTTVILDKTGTVTEGRPALTDIVPLAGQNADEVLTLAASVEVLSEHPLAKAVAGAAKEKNLALLKAEAFTQAPGRVEALVSGRKIAVGNVSVLDDTEAQKLSPALEKLADEGKTALVVVADGKPLAVLAVADAVKPESHQAIAALKARGLKVRIVTGDNARTAAAVARAVGLTAADVTAQVLPADKERIVRELQADGETVLMVGDGINDAPALTRADIGMAIGAGTDVAVESADIVLVRSRLTDVAAAYDISAAVMRNIKENLFWAFFYNAVGIPVAAGVFYLWLGWTLNPMIAAAAMSMSSVSVVSNALRLRGWKRAADLAVTVKAQTKERPEPQKEQQPETPCDAKLIVEGMHCPHCSGRVEKALAATAGVTKAEVDLAKKTALVWGSASAETLKAAVVAAGYTVSSTTTKKKEIKMTTYVLTVNGMHCTHCSGSVQKALSAVAGVTKAAVDLESKKATVEGEGVNPEALKAAVTDAGFEVADIRSE